MAGFDVEYKYNFSNFKLDNDFYGIFVHVRFNHRTKISHAIQKCNHSLHRA